MTEFLDVLVTKEYQSQQGGELKQKIAWNKIGRAWTSKNGTLSFELFLIPNQRYFIQLKDQALPITETKPEEPQN